MGRRILKMQVRMSPFLSVCLSLMMSIGSCRCKPALSVPQVDGAAGFLRPALGDLAEEEEEQAARARLESFLGNMKQKILRKLNLTSVPQEQGRVDPPPFMMELYNRHAADGSSAPLSDVIRSFGVLDVIRSVKRGNTSEHRLLFNVSIPCHEEVTAAELRLFTLPNGAPPECTGCQATISVYNMERGSKGHGLHFLTSRRVKGSHGAWEVFDVTGPKLGWITPGQSTKEFKVHIQQGECAVLDVSLSLKDNSSAILIVFSNDPRSRRKDGWNDLKPTVVHVEDRHPPKTKVLIDNNEIPIDIHPRRRKRAEHDYCRRTSLKVNFKEIGWDSWIIAPPEYDAFECRGMCYFPLTDDVTPSKHAVIQTLVNLGNPKKANMACCVPTKLDPITVLYKENGILTMKHFYEEMKVAECGCR
ncbi:growth/differentiation factor 2 [Paramormyrops kingsleyae]|nr:growth/differentiation factor 2-like [Paramormyrops kingsleyae]